MTINIEEVIRNTTRFEFRDELKRYIRDPGGIQNPSITWPVQELEGTELHIIINHLEKEVATLKKKLALLELEKLERAIKK